MTNLIVTWQDIKRLEESPIYQIHGAFDDYPFPYDDAARVFIKFPLASNGIESTFCIGVLPSGIEGLVFSLNDPKGMKWKQWEEGYEIFPSRKIHEKTVTIINHVIHCAVTALRTVSAYRLPRVEAQKRDVKRATKGMSRTPETKTDKYYVLKLSGRSLDYLPEPQGKCREGVKHRYHMCRGHYRHLKSGKVVFVKGHYRGDKALGIVHKDYAL